MNIKCSRCGKENSFVLSYYFTANDSIWLHSYLELINGCACVYYEHVIYSTKGYLCMFRTTIICA